MAPDLAESGAGLGVLTLHVQGQFPNATFFEPLSINLHQASGVLTALPELHRLSGSRERIRRQPERSARG